MTKEHLSIYIHYPFCKSKCPYCDFNSHVSKSIDAQRFLSAYEKELEFFSAKISAKTLTNDQSSKREVTSIFFGGGTPSLMPIFLVEGILKKISELWHVKKDCEISLEANPTSFESSKFKALRSIGINRLSLGIQALNDEDLKFLGREHSAKEAITTIELTQKIFDNFSFDLIYARPSQTLKDWRNELERAIDFGSKHLSLYQLTIEKGTKFFSQFQQKKFVMPDEELSAQFYEMTNEITAANAFELYEISNYAKNNLFCRHNLVYWQGGDYLGIGAGAHSRLYFADENRYALMMLHEPNSWLKKVEEVGAGIQKLEKISSAELAQELILMGLRLVDGIDESIFLQHLQKKFNEIFAMEKLQALERSGLIEIGSSNIKIPSNKRLLTNTIVAKVCDCLMQ